MIEAAACRTFTPGRPGHALDGPARADLLARLASRSGRAALEAFAAAAIDLLDALDGDPDREATGDEGEPDFARAMADPRGNGAGCPISDPGGCEHDGREPEQCGGGGGYHPLDQTEPLNRYGWPFAGVSPWRTA